MPKDGGLLLVVKKETSMDYLPLRTLYF